MSAGERKLISHRVHFTSLNELLDNCLPRDRFEAAVATGKLAVNYSGPDGYDRLRQLLHDFGSRLLDCIGHDLEQGAARGIQEALKLIQNPEYYEVKKRRQKREADRSTAAYEKQKADRERWARGEYTDEERQGLIATAQREIEWHKKELKVTRERLRKLESAIPTEPEESGIEIDWNILESLGKQIDAISEDSSDEEGEKHG